MILWRAHSRATTFPAFVKSPDQNVLLITIDTLRADALGVTAAPRVARPISIGSRATASASRSRTRTTVVTLASHTNILTGKYPYQHGVRDNAGFRLDAGSPTLATLLHAQRLRHGRLRRRVSAQLALRTRAGLRRVRRRVREGSRIGSTSSCRSGPQARSSSRRDGVDRRTARSAGSPGSMCSIRTRRTPRRRRSTSSIAGDPYPGEVAYVDSALGPLLDPARPQSRPTTLVVTGDHGEALGDHGEQTHGLFAYESTLKIPLILAQVGGRQRGASPRRDEPTSPSVTSISCRRSMRPAEDRYARRSYRAHASDTPRMARPRRGRRTSKR